MSYMNRCLNSRQWPKIKYKKSVHELFFHPLQAEILSCLIRKPDIDLLLTINETGVVVLEPLFDLLVACLDRRL